MQIPAAFNMMCQWMDHEIRDISEEARRDPVAYALARLSAGEKSDIKAFLTDRLGAGLSGDELQAMFRRSSVRFYIPDNEQLRGFFAEIVRQIG